MNTRIQHLTQILRTAPPRIVYPEGKNPIILAAVRQLVDTGAIRAVLLAPDRAAVETVAQRHHISLDGMTITAIDPMIAATISSSRPLVPRLAHAAALLRDGAVDGMVAGIDHPTPEVLRAALKGVGLTPDVDYASSFFIIDTPTFHGGENGLLLFADCGMNIAPTAEQLADITLASAQNAQCLGWQPRVALLSYSTKGSAGGDSAALMQRTREIILDRDPLLQVDGELQVDAAINETIARKKAGNSPVAGRANILIFPDLASGNIAYKLVEQLAGANAYGPLLQGFAKPISDVSRGSTVEDIVGTSLLLAKIAQSSEVENDHE